MPFSISGPRFAGRYKFTCDNPDFLNAQYQAATKRKGKTFQKFESLMSEQDIYGIANVTPELVQIDHKEIMGFSGEDAINFRTIKKMYAAIPKAKMTGLVNAFLHRFSIKPNEFQEIQIDETTFLMNDLPSESGTESDGLMIAPRKKDSKKGPPSRLSR